MNRRALLCLLFLLPALPAVSGSFEVIELRHRPADELLPIVSPHLWPGESISGEGFRILLSAPPPRQAVLAQMIRSLDVPPVPIRITVKLASREEMAHDMTEGTAVISTRPGETRSRGRLEITSTEDRERTRRSWQVTGLAGEPLRIDTGLDFPYPATGVLVQDGQSRQLVTGLRYRRLHSGFYALVQLNSDRVIVDIAPRREDLLDAPGGALRHEALRTRVTGRVGEWIDLGGNGNDIRERPGTLTQQTTTSDRRFWLRVERLEP